MERSTKQGQQTLILFEKWMDTTRWLMELTQAFPKRLRHSLTNRIEVRLLSVLEQVNDAAYGRDRLEKLELADRDLSALRVHVRLAYDLKALSHGQYEEAAQRLGEAGRILGGWLKKTGIS